MNDVKIVVAGIEMTPEQARKVHAELSRLFAPAPPQLMRPSTPLQPGRPAPDWGRFPDNPYMLRFTSSWLDNVGIASALQKQGNGC